MLLRRFSKARSLFAREQHVVHFYFSINASQLLDVRKKTESIPSEDEVQPRRKAALRRESLKTWLRTGARSPTDKFSGQGEIYEKAIRLWKMRRAPFWGGFAVQDACAVRRHCNSPPRL
jgi:hypothetical protein